MTYPLQTLSGLVSEITTRNGKKEELAVFSVTNSDGFVPSGDYFKKQVFSKDLVNYKVVPPGCFAYNPSRVNVGSIDYLQQASPVLVSPLYIVFRAAPELDPAYLKRFLLSEMGIAQIRHRTQGAVRDSLKISGLKKIEIPLPSIDEQKLIVGALKKADVLRRQRQESLQLTEKLLQSVFIDMFGDPTTNPKDWPMLELGKFGIVQTGNTPPRSNKANYSATGLEWIKTDNIVEDRVLVTTSAERLSEAGAKAARVAPAGSLLVACIAGSEKSIGRAALTDREVAFNQQINSITPHADTSSLFLYFLIKLARRQIQAAAAKGMKKMVNKSTFESLRFIAPGYDEQKKFEIIAERLIAQKSDCQAQSNDLDIFFSALQQRAFRGELDLSRLKLEDAATPEAVAPAHKPVTIEGVYRRPGAFIAPPEIEAQMLKFEEILNWGPGDSIPWSEDYFKYRTLSQVLRPPFNCTEIMEKVHNDMPDATYEDVRSKVFQYLEEGILEQWFDDESREIYFQPRA